MPRLLNRDEGADELALAHCDPDLRPALLADGLLINGQDPFAERRRMMRERQTGRPDPAPIAVPKIAPPQEIAISQIRCRRCGRGAVLDSASDWRFGPNWWECPACRRNSPQGMR